MAEVALGRLFEATVVDTRTRGQRDGYIILLTYTVTAFTVTAFIVTAFTVSAFTVAFVFVWW